MGKYVISKADFYQQSLDMRIGPALWSRFDMIENDDFN
jgi:hypothetical protein